MIPSADTTLAVVMDVDGVVSPVHGKSEFGDDVVAGHLFGPVYVSATVCRDLDQLSAQPGATFVWLTDWRTDMRAAMNPFPGHDWDTTADPDDGRRDAIVRAGDRWGEMPWWKWWALDVWLDTHPQIRRLVWCDDHLSRTASIEEDEEPRPRPVRTRGGDGGHLPRRAERARRPHRAEQRPRTDPRRPRADRAHGQRGNLPKAQLPRSRQGDSMTKPEHPPQEPGPVSRARQLLELLDETPIAERRTAFHQHHLEDMRRAIEDLLTLHDAARPRTPAPSVPATVWTVWDCSDLIGVFTNREAAQQFRAEHVARATADYSGLADTIRETVTVSVLDVRS